MQHPRNDDSQSYLANFRRYWAEHLIHLAVGAVSGSLLLSGEPWAGAVVMATVWVRQSLEFQKRSGGNSYGYPQPAGGILESCREAAN